MRPRRHHITCNNQNARQPTTYSQTVFSFYEVEGGRSNEDRLETDVTVTYLELDTFSAAYLAAVGIDFRDCETSLTMRWVLQDWFEHHLTVRPSAFDGAFR